MKSKYAPIGDKLIQNPDLQQRVGSAVWLFLYLVLNRDWKTGNLQRRVETMADDLKRNRKQIQRWLRILEKEGLIITRRLWHGYFIKIPDKFVMGHECPGYPVESWDKSGSVMGQIRTSDGTNQDQPDVGVPSLSEVKETEKSFSSDVGVPSPQSLYQESLNKTPPTPPAGGIDSYEPEAEKKGEAEALWAKCMKFIEGKVIPESFNTWFVPVFPITMRRDRVVIGVPTRMHAICLERNFNSEIRGALLEVGGFDSPPVPEFQIMSA
ncbi:MAG: hypothetical protein IIA63_01465 [Nitrospinae bacterium]|nr:hypothetical protein [Nitrospinota bacterium]